MGIIWTFLDRITHRYIHCVGRLYTSFISAKNEHFLVIELCYLVPEKLFISIGLK